MDKKISTIAVIPAYNEGRNILTVLERVKAYVDGFVVVDDGSKDDTYQVVSEYIASQKAAGHPIAHNMFVLTHKLNMGKGAALTTGCEAAELLKAEVIIVMDADNQHNPDHIPDFVRTLHERNVDIVFGSRAFNDSMPAVMKFGNQLLSTTIQRLFHVNVRDTQSGYRAFTPIAFEKIRWQSTGYSVETEMLVRVSEADLRYAEIDIDTIYLDDYKGTTAFDGLKILGRIIQWKLF